MVDDDDAIFAPNVVVESTIVGAVSPTTTSSLLVDRLLLALSSTGMVICYDNSIN